jgi:hypothetical protein
MTEALQVSHRHDGQQAASVQAGRGRIVADIEGRRALESTSQTILVRDLLYKSTLLQHVQRIRHMTPRYLTLTHTGIG